MDNWIVYFYTNSHSQKPIAAKHLGNVQLSEVLNQGLPEFVNYSNTYYIKPVNLSEKDYQRTR